MPGCALEVSLLGTNRTMERASTPYGVVNRCGKQRENARPGADRATFFGTVKGIP